MYSTVLITVGEGGGVLMDLFSVPLIFFFSSTINLNVFQLISYMN